LPTLQFAAPSAVNSDMQDPGRHGTTTAARDNYLDLYDRSMVDEVAEEARTTEEPRKLNSFSAEV